MILNLSHLNPLSANFKKWSNTLKQFVGKLPTNCLSVFGHFVELALKGLRKWLTTWFITDNITATFQLSFALCSLCTLCSLCLLKKKSRKGNGTSSHGVEKGCVGNKWVSKFDIADVENVAKSWVLKSESHLPKKLFYLLWWEPFKNKKHFSFSRYLNFCFDFLAVWKRRLDQKDNVNYLSNTHISQYTYFPLSHEGERQPDDDSTVWSCFVCILT